VISKDLKPRDRGAPREVHFAGIDVGLVNDGTSIALTRINQGKVELVYHEIWYAKRRWKDVNPHLISPLVPYANSLQDVSRLDMAEIANWFKALTTRFYIQKGIFDQWSGIVFEQELHKLGLRQFESRNFFATDSSLMYQTFKMFMYNKQLALYDYPRNTNADGSDGGRRSPLIQEILELQAYSGGKNIVTVEAPRSTGKHDDMSDALARSILLVSEYIKDNPSVLDSKSIATPLDQTPRVVSYHHYQRTMQRLHGGSSRVGPRLPRR